MHARLNPEASAPVSYLIEGISYLLKITGGVYQTRNTLYKVSHRCASFGVQAHMRPRKVALARALKRPSPYMEILGVYRRADSLYSSDSLIYGANLI
jgi:hypothetical protein